LKKLFPTRYDDSVELGGSTKPWKVFAILESDKISPKELPYVVKLFSLTSATQQPCIAKEFICNFLAKEFDLLVPQSGIINLHTQLFSSTLKKPQLEILKKKHVGATYASTLLDGTIVSENVQEAFSGLEEKATIFAFDCFILNSDRGGFRNKPNLLIFEEQFMLIDHELTLPFMDGLDKSGLNKLLNNIIEEKKISPYPYQEHLFYKSLKRYNGNKNNLFDTFGEYLSKLNLNKLELLINELKTHNIYTGSSDFLLEYIREVKSNSEKFCSSLYKLII
jgi:hypothetical protein